MNEFYRYNATIIDVYDGDTVTCNISLGFGVLMHKQKIRLYGINTPELRGSDKENGIKARDFLRSQILNKEIILQTIKDKKGKYGRWLGIIHHDDVNINDLLVAKGFAEKKQY